MDSDVVSVHPDVPAVDVASTIARYDLLACPVVDDAGKMLGIVTVDDAIDAIIPPTLRKSCRASGPATIRAATAP